MAAMLSLATVNVMPRRIEFQVPGIPQPQGSARAFRHAHTGRVIVTTANKNLRPWRLDVKQLALEANVGQEGFEGPVAVEVVFQMPRPGYHFGKRGLKSAAPHFSSSRPDLDKLARGICDGLRDAGIYRDDGQVARLTVEKVFAEHPGARIVVSEL